MVRENVERILEYKMTLWNITLFISITMLCGIDNIPWNILYLPHIQYECAKIFKNIPLIMSMPRNTVMDLNKVMKIIRCRLENVYVEPMRHSRVFLWELDGALENYCGS